MFTIKVVYQDDEFKSGKRTELYQSNEVFVVYHCDPEFKDYAGDGINKDVVAAVVTDSKTHVVGKNQTIYVVNQNGKTVQAI